MADKNNKTSDAPKLGFLQSLFANLFHSNSPEADIKRKLKAIAKDLSKTKYHSFYKPQTGEMTPQFAKLFYDIYKIISPAQNAFRSVQNKNAFKAQIINFSLSENQLNLLEHLNEEKIREMARKVPLRDIKQKIETEMETFSAEFDFERASRCENLYKALLTFADFVMFDYYFMLKKFSSGMQENSFNSTPTFDKVNAEYIVDELQDFISIIYSIPDDIVWDPFFAFLKETRGSEMVSATTWKKILTRMKALQSSQALEMIVKLITKKPDFRPKTFEHNETIVDGYVDKIREEVTTTIATLESQQKASKASNFLSQIFGSSDINQLHYYTSAAGDVLAKKELSTYLYADALNYLKAFLLEFVKADLRQYHDIVVIRGQWDATMAAPFSNAFQELLQVSDQITMFDNNLAEEGPIGMKIKTLLPKIAHDPGAENIINRLVGDANENARSFIIESTQNFILIGKQIKQLIEDHNKSKPLIVANWKELERFSEKPLKQFSVDVYKKLYLFVQLMQTCISGEEN